jgi:hypothetical protein
VVSWVAVEPSGKGLPSRLKTSKPLWAEPSCRASVSGAPKVIASRGISTPRSSRDHHLIIKITKITKDQMLISLSWITNEYKSIPTTMKKDTARPNRQGFESLGLGC